MVLKQEHQGTGLNRLLLYGPWFLGNDGDGETSDLPFIVDEMIANGAVGAAIPDLGQPAESLKRLPDPLRAEATTTRALELILRSLRRRKTGIKNTEVAPSWHRILSPTCSELGGEFEQWPAFAFRFKENPAREMIAAFFGLLSLHRFLLGLRCELQVFLDVEHIQTSIISAPASLQDCRGRRESSHPRGRLRHLRSSVRWRCPIAFDGTDVLHRRVRGVRHGCHIPSDMPRRSFARLPRQGKAICSSPPPSVQAIPVEPAREGPSQLHFEISVCSDQAADADFGTG